MTVLLASILLIIAANVMVRVFLPAQPWEAVPFHSTVEALGALAAVAMAAFLLLVRKNRNELAHYVWVGSALIGMGILDGFHAAVLPGHGFVWLHSVAVLIGGFLFALVWLPERVARSPWSLALPWVVTIAAPIFGALSIAFRQAFPVMVIQGQFTADAKAINLIGGILFLAATVRFVVRHWRNASGDNLLFASLGLLFGSAGLLFPLSSIWQGDWWLWHFLRLIAYFLALGYVLVIFQRAQGEASTANEKLKANVTELANANKALQGEIAERKRAEDAVARQAREILELSNLAVQVWEGIVLVPLIGTLDSQRAQAVMETLLRRIAETNAQVALLDIAGVPAIDTQTARYLVETISAVKLLGAQVVVTGVRPAIAQTMVHLGIDLAGVTTRSSLAAGLRHAVDRLKPVFEKGE